LTAISHLEEHHWYNERLVATALDALKKNGFDVVYAPNREDALKILLSSIPANARVGVGGSVTLREVGIVEALKNRGNVVADHWTQGATLEDKLAIRRSHLSSDVFLSSANAVTLDGKLVNADGTGNRVAAMIFGPRKVIIVIGLNKIVKNLEEALQRIRNVAAPLNSKRLGLHSPCGETGKCDEEDCDPPDRSCNVITILERRPDKTDTTVMLVGESLGF